MKRADSMFTEAELTAFAERVRADRATDGLPPTIRDGGTLDRIAVIVSASVKRTAPQTRKRRRREKVR